MKLAGRASIASLFIIVPSLIAWLMADDYRPAIGFMVFTLPFSLLLLLPKPGDAICAWLAELAGSLFGSLLHH